LPAASALGWVNHVEQQRAHVQEHGN
jgi:hypothetical protein